jgi:hypothetical protein
MRNGIYALLAVVVGVALIGVLPGQLSNMASPVMEVATLQGTSIKQPQQLLQQQVQRLMPQTRQSDLQSQRQATPTRT